RRGETIRCSHILMPNVLFNMVYDAVTGWTEHLSWRVPVDDVNHITFTADRVHVDAAGRADYIRRRDAHRKAIADAVPADEVANTILNGGMTMAEAEGHPDLLSIQDLVALMGQGAIAQRELDWLGHSDVQVVMLRRLWAEELQALEAGRSIRP